MQNIKHVPKCTNYEPCAICTGSIFCTFFETIFFPFRDKQIFFCGGGGVGWRVTVEVIMEDLISEIV